VGLNNNKQNIKHMKKILNLFYKHNKQKQEEKPKITIRLKSTVTPNEKLKFDDWCKEYNVSLIYDKKIIHIG